MNWLPQFSMQRFKGIILKEFIQMRRDRLTFAMMMGIPLLQLILFGFAINVNPRHLPVDILMGDNGPQGRTILYAFKDTSYFDFIRLLKSEADGREALARGDAQFVISVPPNFSRDILRGDRPVRQATPSAL
jgi:ABC-2 type transport system permease protein